MKIMSMAAILCLVSAAAFAGYHAGRRSVEPEIEVKWKTVHITDPKPVLQINTGRYIFVTLSEDEELPHMELSDSSAAPVVALPEEMKEYRDSTELEPGVFMKYQIAVSGYQPSLTYANFEIPHMVQKQKKSPVSFNWGITGGIGYGIISHRPDIYVGFGGVLTF